MTAESDPVCGKKIKLVKWNFSETSSVRDRNRNSARCISRTFLLTFLLDNAAKISGAASLVLDAEEVRLHSETMHCERLMLSHGSKRIHKPLLKKGQTNAAAALAPDTLMTQNFLSNLFCFI